MALWGGCLSANDYPMHMTRRYTATKMSMRLWKGIWFLLVGLCFAPGMANAQSWCPPGAVWEYRIVGFAEEGCGTMTYVGDTILDGRQAQRIVYEWMSYSYWDEMLLTGLYTGYTSFGNDVVYQYVPYLQAWDTLYWFDAPIGARWAPPHFDYGGAYCPLPAGLLEVVDTGTVDMNGIMLHYVDVKKLAGPGGQEEEFRIYERIGNLIIGWPVNDGCIVSEWPYRLHTYSDQLGTLYDEGGPFCPDILGIEGMEWEQKLALAAYPNPGGNQLSLSWDVPGRYEVAIRDLQGRMVWQGHYRKGEGPLNMSGLVPGMYVLTTTTKDGIRASAQWVKL